MTETGHAQLRRASHAIVHEARARLARLQVQIAASQHRIRESRDVIAASRALIASFDPAPRREPR